LHMCMFIDCSLDWHVGVVSGLIYILVQWSYTCKV